MLKAAHGDEVMIIIQISELSKNIQTRERKM
jgi:hypothetical protein